jgi:hypothetical protein
MQIFTYENLLLAVIILPAGWAGWIGETVGLKYWVYDSVGEMSKSVGATIFGYLSFIEVLMLLESDNQDFWVLAFFGVLCLYFSVPLYLKALQQTRDVLKSIVLFYGKIAYSLVFIFVIFFLAASFSQRKN